ncbi:MAG: DUF4065 domain-containing protein [Defluviitaleaceae bacterium]|nr:DUF4065 domain-containing protein [Defluviitaleaceae bacterium]
MLIGFWTTIYENIGVIQMLRRLTAKKSIYNPTLIVANTVLDHSFKNGYDVSHMKLQKLIYFIYKKHLKDTDYALFAESFQAWQYGPVLRSVYNEFKEWGSKPIRSYLYFGDTKEALILADDMNEIYTAVNFVLSIYSRYSGAELSDFTHKEGTAWYLANQRNSHLLRNSDIKNEEWVLP